ncbi:MAG TPA: hypothetical protein V6C71_05725 [Coleofasciculaceae cyanobacterium]|jgi:hypothetical protein
MKYRQSISSFMFALILICFLFPFITHEFIDNYTLTGFEIVTGITDNPNSGDSKVIYTYFLALLGLIASFLKSQKSKNIAFEVGIFGAILLLWLRVETAVFITYEIGFWSVLLLFIAVIIVNNPLSK